MGEVEAGWVSATAIPRCSRCSMNTFGPTLCKEKADQGKKVEVQILLPQHLKNDPLVIVVPWGA